MTRKLIHFAQNDAGRLRCDAVGCGFVEPVALAFTEELIGRPCPLCGANLLTRRDYADTQRLFAFIGWINRWFGWLGSETPPANAHRVQVRTHNGEVTTKWRRP